MEKLPLRRTNSLKLARNIIRIFPNHAFSIHSPAHAALNRTGKAVFVIPPLCSQKHSPKGKTSNLKKISRPRYASASIFSSALVATASTLILALR